MQTINQLFQLLLKDIQKKMNDEFDRNFERNTFFAEAWNPNKHKFHWFAHDADRRIAQIIAFRKDRHQFHLVAVLTSLCGTTQQRRNL